jgi:hypothetical protein
LYMSCKILIFQYKWNYVNNKDWHRWLGACVACMPMSQSTWRAALAAIY